METETVKVGNFFGPLTAIRLYASETGGSILVRDVIVTLANGRQRDIMDRRRIRIETGEVEVFELPREATIRSVEIDVRATRNDSRRATLRVDGRRSKRSRLGRSDFAPLELREIKSDTRTVNLPVGRQEGRFSVLKLASLDEGIRVGEVTVNFFRGRSEKFRVGKVIGGPDTAPILELGGRTPRAIRSVDVTVRGGRSRRVQRLALLGRETPERRRDRRRGRDDRRDGDLRLIGDRLSDRRDERIEVPIDDAGEAQSIRIRAGRNPLDIRQVIFERRRGRRTRVRVRERIDADELSREIEIPRGRGRLDTVTLLVEPSRRRGTVRVEVLALEERRGRRGRDRDSYDDDDRVGRLPPGRWHTRPRLSGDSLAAPYYRVATQRLDDRHERYVLKFDRSVWLSDIAFRSLRGDSQVRSIDITYGNGKSESLPIATVIKRGEVSRAIKLDGNRRRVREVSVVARTAPRSRRDARLELYASRAPEPRAHQRQADRFEREGEWVLLGRQNAEIFSRDNDTFKVGREYGRFNEIRVRARRTDVRIYGMKIRFGNGVVEDVPIFGKLKKNRTTDPVVLRNKGRFIEEISLQYRSKFSLRGEGKVEVWGRTAPGRARSARRDNRDEGRRLLGDILREFGRKFGN